LKNTIDNQRFFGPTVPPAGTPPKSGTLLLLSRSAAALLSAPAALLLRASNSGAWLLKRKGGVQPKLIASTLRLAPIGVVKDAAVNGVF
jgi:hypothetical protein